MTSLPRNEIRTWTIRDVSGYLLLGVALVAFMLGLSGIEDEAAAEAAGLLRPCLVVTRSGDLAVDAVANVVYTGNTGNPDHNHRGGAPWQPPTK